MWLGLSEAGSQAACSTMPGHCLQNDIEGGFSLGEIRLFLKLLICDPHMITTLTNYYSYMAFCRVHYSPRNLHIPCLLIILITGPLTKLGQCSGQEIHEVWLQEYRPHLRWINRHLASKLILWTSSARTCLSLLWPKFFNLKQGQQTLDVKCVFPGWLPPLSEGRAWESCFGDFPRGLAQGRPQVDRMERGNKSYFPTGGEHPRVVVCPWVTEMHKDLTKKWTAALLLMNFSPEYRGRY